MEKTELFSKGRISKAQKLAVGPLLVVALLLLPSFSDADAKKRPRSASLTLKVVGIPTGSPVGVIVEGPRQKGQRFRKVVSQAKKRRLSGLAFGRYKIRAKSSHSSLGTAWPTKPRQFVSLSRKKIRATVTVVYRVQPPTPDPDPPTPDPDPEPDPPTPDPDPPTPDPDPPTPDPDPLIASSISAGGDHTCAIRESGQAVCWGKNNLGQLGRGSPFGSLEPVSVQGLSDAIKLSSGARHTCAIRESGQAVCWGDGYSGQLGNGQMSDYNFPVNVQGLTDAKVISAGEAHSCAIRESGQVLCWGSNEFNQVTSGGASNSTPFVVSSVTDAKDVSSGTQQNCAIRESGQAVCWGGFGGGGGGRTPVAISGLSDAKVISSGYGHNCAIRESGQAVCWGYGDWGQLGDGVDYASGPDSGSSVPVEVQGLDNAKAISAGRLYSCGVRLAGQVLCWGGNFRGQLGDGTTINSLSPVSVFGSFNAQVVSTGNRSAFSDGSLHTCAIREADIATCWGSNVDGQLGNGSLASSLVPVNVLAGDA